MPMPVPQAEPGVVLDGKGMTGDDLIPLQGIAPGEPNGGVDPAQPFGFQRDSLWTKSVVTWLVLSVIFLALSVQAVSPTRRWRLRRGARAKRSPSA
jgi:hypothetical protein